MRLHNLQNQEVNSLPHRAEVAPMDRAVSPISMPVLSPRIETFLDAVEKRLRGIPLSARAEIRQELSSHIHATRLALEELGETPESALESALQRFGETGKIARQYRTAWARSGTEPVRRLLWRCVGLGLVSALLEFACVNPIIVNRQWPSLEYLEFALIEASTLSAFAVIGWQFGRRNAAAHLSSRPVSYLPLLAACLTVGVVQNLAVRLLFCLRFAHHFWTSSYYHYQIPHQIHDLLLIGMPFALTFALLASRWTTHRSRDLRAAIVLLTLLPAFIGLALAYYSSEGLVTPSRYAALAFLQYISPTVFLMTLLFRKATAYASSHRAVQ